MSLEPKKMPEIEERYTRADRDMIVITNATVLTIKEDIKEMKESLMGRVSLLENNKAAAHEIEKIYSSRTPQWKEFEERISKLEYWRWWIIGAFSLLGVVVALIVYIYINDLNSIREAIASHEKNSTILNEDTRRSLEKSMYSAAQQAIDDFAEKNFEVYNK